MNEHRVAQIVVPTTEQSAGKRLSRFGSGYLIGKRLVLTARHVVLPERRDEQLPIELRFARIDAERWYEATVVWTGGDDLDAAILRLEEEPTAHATQGCEFLSSWVPSTGMTWDARGYPSVARCVRPDGGGEWRIEPFQGPTFSYDRNDSTCTLDVAPPPAFSGDAWQGMSGAAVFSAERGERLFAIVSAQVGWSQGSRLRATPTACLLSLPEVRELLGIGDQLAAVRTEVSRVLRAAWAEIRDALLRRLEQLDQPAPTTPEELAELMLESLVVEELLDLMHDTHQVLAGERSQRGVKAIERVLWAVLPSLYEPHLVRSLSRSHDHTRMLEVPVDTLTFVEVLSAGLDRKATWFQRSFRSAEPPRGAVLVPTPPEEGIATSLDRYLDSLRSHLAARFLDERDQRRSAAVIDRLINDELAWQAERSDQGRRFYFVVEPEMNERDRLRLVDRLGRSYPDLRLFCLAPCDDETVIRERALSRPIREIVGRSGLEEQ